jgi:hypothetical protein
MMDAYAQILCPRSTSDAYVIEYTVVLKDVRACTHNVLLGLARNIEELPNHT